mmetsp:Transcript_43126/g.102368  ORF Transcript_43126/g.102368 Transcript_43126/m.102368 type:complete len:353 (+) Transcript_43126:472-1530(+)
MVGKFSKLLLVSQGLCSERSPSSRKMYFKLFFPRPPHEGVEYRAAKMKDGYNFVGLVLGHGGTTLQRIQRLTGTKIEIHDQCGNLNGSHPAVNDPTLHALITADSKEKLVKGVKMVAEALQPLNTRFERIEIEPNGSALLKPKAASAAAAAPSESSEGGKSSDEAATPLGGSPQLSRSSSSGRRVSLSPEHSEGKAEGGGPLAAREALVRPEAPLWDGPAAGMDSSLAGSLWEADWLRGDPCGPLCKQGSGPERRGGGAPLFQGLGLQEGLLQEGCGEGWYDPLHGLELSLAEALNLPNKARCTSWPAREPLPCGSLYSQESIPNRAAAETRGNEPGDACIEHLVQLLVPRG